MRSKYKPRMSLPEDREKKPVSKPKPVPVKSKPRALVEKAPVKKPYRASVTKESFSDFVDQFTARAREMIIDSGIKPEKIKELKYVNKDVCHIRFTDGTFRFFYVGKSANKLRKQTQEEIDDN